jgi:uncharacterized protein (DUF934 family)
VLAAAPVVDRVHHAERLLRERVGHRGRELAIGQRLPASTFRTRPLGPLGFECSQHRRTPRPSVQMQLLYTPTASIERREREHRAPLLRERVGHRGREIAVSECLRSSGCDI